jgi:hypothetical protein
MSDPHIVRPGTLPTPFSAAEIRDATVDGMTLLLRTTSHRGSVQYRRTTFVACDREGALRSFAPADAGGREVSEPEQAYSTWAELQGHAVFGETQAKRTQETRETALGTLDCWRYDVSDDDGDSTFWFALRYPGMPVVYQTRDTHGVVTSLTELIEIVTP